VLEKLIHGASLPLGPWIAGDPGAVIQAGDAGNWARSVGFRYGEAMNRTLITLATASIFALGCGRAALDQGVVTPAPAAPDAAAEAKAPAPAPAAKPAVGSEAAPAATTSPARTPGDFVVYRFTGSFRRAPLTLTERVVAKKGSVLTIDFAAAEGDKREELRVSIDEASPTHNEVTSVARLVRGVAKPAGIEAYEALMARTALAADSNDALVGTEEVTVDVGGAAVPAKQTTYQVRVGKRPATLRTLESAAFVWGDVGGEITAGGKVLYRAEVIEAGHDDAAARAALAE
jgi:hypothetical protein